MSRARLVYSERRPLARGGFDPDVPTAGYYRHRLRSGGMPVAVHIFLGPVIDPETGEAMLERGERWQATVNGRPVDLYTVWPGCAREPIDEHEAAYLAERERWGRQHAPHSPEANPHKRIDPLKSPILF